MSLKLCAHCGQTASELGTVDEVSGRERHAVTCSNCRMTTSPELTAAEARLVWNRRVEASTAERIQKIVARYGGDLCAALLVLERVEAMEKASKSEVAP